MCRGLTRLDNIITKGHGHRERVAKMTRIDVSFLERGVVYTGRESSELRWVLTEEWISKWIVRRRFRQFRAENTLPSA